MTIGLQRGKDGVALLMLRARYRSGRGRSGRFRPACRRSTGADRRMSPSLVQSVTTSAWVANSLKAIASADFETSAFIPVRSENIFFCTQAAANTATPQQTSKERGAKKFDRRFSVQRPLHHCYMTPLKVRT